MAMIGRLRDAGRLRDQVGEALYLNAARAHLMTGDMAAVQMLSDWLAADFPRSEAAAKAAVWAAGKGRRVRIGALLPLSGEYARYGQQALRGMRLALDSIEGGDQVTLRIADTEGKAAQCLSAYRQLMDEGVSMIVGPLLGDCTQALAPHLHGNVPVLSLTSHAESARDSSELFVHTLGLAMQAHFMAAHAWRQGERRMAVISMDLPSFRQEADAFTQAFVELGGQVVDRLDLQQGHIDYRSELRGLRMRTDDEELLAELDEELALSIEPDQEIRMPVSFDAVYLALPGKQVSLLAGQLAYVDVTDVRLYGSDRWQDGHLLDDKGRYLGRAQFSDVVFPNGDSSDLQHFMLAWRDVWGVVKPGKLTGLAYDSTLIAVMLTSRLGFSDRDAVAGLEDPAGFPGLTGHVQFDQEGVGHKEFELFRIRRGHIVPAG